MNIKNLIFDVDGTLWDTTPLVSSAWTRALHDLGIQKNITSSELKNLFGKPMDYIIACLFPRASGNDRSIYMQRCCEAEEKMLEKSKEDFLYPGVHEAIPVLSEHFGLYIVSNCQCGYIELFIKKSGLSKYFSDFESFGATGLQKSENIRLVIERNGLENAAYVGDIQSDCDAAHIAGIPFIHAAYGFGTADCPEMAVACFKELSKLI